MVNEVAEHKSRYEHIANSQTILQHEFRTPLSTSLMFLEGILNSSTLTEEARKLLIIVVSEINLLLSLVNDMLDLKLIELGRF